MWHSFGHQDQNVKLLMRCVSEKGFVINYKHVTDVFLISEAIRLHYKTLKMAGRLDVSEEVPFNIVLLVMYPILLFTVKGEVYEK